MKAIGVIPARWGSTRFPGKPLALINGQPLLAWVIAGSKSSRALQEIWVATDDERIAALARSLGVQAVLTDADLATGTDRIWQAVLRSKSEVRLAPGDVIVNIQGDEPLIEGHLLDDLVRPFLTDDSLEMATLGRALDEEALISSQTAKIVLNARDEAMYFSRFPIPYSRVTAEQSRGSTGPVLTGALKHIGIYAYRLSFLEKFCASPQVAVEQFEGLEQLRALYLGARIKVVRADHDSWGVDLPSDVPKIEVIMKGRRK